MFDGLLKSKFYTKCKSLIKMTKTRLEALKKKKCSVVKFLKNDMADLLRNGLDYNAYGRAEGFLVEQKMVARYDFIEQFCECISKNLDNMTKQRECPEECKAAVQSLIFAASGISEFPELRDLRNLFTERHGSSLEPYINKLFVETFKPVSATEEMKFQVLREIAAEFSIEWNSKSLEQKLSPPAREVKQQRRGASLSKGELGYRGRENGIEEKHNMPTSSSEDEMFSSHKGDSSDIASSSSVGSVSEDEVESKKPWYSRFGPPPYVKPTAEKVESKTEESRKESTNHQDDFADEAKKKPRSVRRKPLKQLGQENVGIPERPLKPPPGREKFVAKTVKEEDDDGEEGMDEEEKRIDDLLIQYSKPKEKLYDNPPPWKTKNGASEAVSMRKTKSELPAPPGRESYQAEKAKAMHTRTVSEQPQTLNKHVHPNMPDFDDLAARVAALKGR